MGEGVTLDAGSPAQETLRIAALRRLGLLGTSDHARFDRITRTAALAFDVPTATISLIDADEQWLLSRDGPALQSLPRGITFCAQTIRRQDVFVIQDAQNQECFADNPLVAGPPHIRFYAGLPLLSLDGHALGTLCIMDSRARVFDERSRRMLEGFAAWARSELNALERERERVDAASRRLVAPAVHRIRGALTGIHGFSDFLLQQECAPDQRREILAIIHGQAGDLDIVLGELVELLHLEATGGRDFKVARQPLAPLIRAAAAGASEPAKVRLELDEAVPPLLVDTGRVEQVLRRILAHAGPSPLFDISLRRAAEPGFVDLSITQRGVGAARQARRAFEPSFAGNRPGSDSEPRGLALAKAVIEAHGGKALIRESKEPDELRISLLFPL